MGAGSGGFYAALQEFNRVKRDMRRYHANRANRMAMREYRNSLSGIDFPALNLRASFPCFYLCTDCHYLLRESADTCPSCNNASLIDLAEENHASAIRDMDEQARHIIPTWVKVVTAMLTGAAGLTAVLLTWSELVALAAIPIVFVTYRLLRRPMSVLLLRFHGGNPRPARWRLPEPSPAPGQTPDEKVRGTPEAKGELLTSPFTQQPCLAFQADVLFDTPGDARPAEWVIQESDSVEMTIGDKVLPAGRGVLRASIQHIQKPHEDLNLPRYLRERGLSVLDGEYWLFEAVLEPDTAVEAEIYNEPTVGFLTPEHG